MSTEAAAVDVPGQDVDSLITTADQLREYLHTHPTRHAPAQDGQCACGWPHVPPALLGAFQENSSFPTQDQHAAAVLVGALGDLLPSDTSAHDDTGALVPVPWRPLVSHLRDEIDFRDRSIDPRFVTLMKWCLAQGHADVHTLAQVTVMHPEYLSRLLGAPAPAAAIEDEPEPEGGDETPGSAP
ncbi:hypothetical protein [Streptomyces violaceusniger]|uniref:Uncharacterized protein n=1 Tax=Streptomyces violaceusniger (strain Tu 4113) TaxID=653045 RepID=G2PHU9_STRV4|nr:hypothetical protein [Streptomyces violaceusniger]AEM88900.1 hypothetical protein Strvi_0124 [Streptomyces violaceusniger Tu 4113]